MTNGRLLAKLGFVFLDLYGIAGLRGSSPPRNVTGGSASQNLAGLIPCMYTVLNYFVILKGKQLVTIDSSGI